MNYFLKIDWEERHLNWKKEQTVPVGVLDVTDFDVNVDFMPYNFWSFKHRRKVLKYEIVLHMEMDLMVWCSGPWTGRTSDQGIFNQKLRNVLAEKDERVVSDSGYKGAQVITPLPRKRKLDSDEKYNNWQCHALSARLENLNGRFKKFLCLKHPWRHNIQNHKVVFYIILNLVQIGMQINPLRRR